MKFYFYAEKRKQYNSPITNFAQFMPQLPAFFIVYRVGFSIFTLWGDVGHEVTANVLEQCACKFAL